jgi:hypothetical protein
MMDWDFFPGRRVLTPVCQVCHRAGAVWVDPIKWLAYDAGKMIQSLSLTPAQEEQLLTGTHEECKIIDEETVVA